eukprot:4144563-Pyramimonas_sp.AAC.1
MLDNSVKDVHVATEEAPNRLLRNSKIDEKAGGLVTQRVLPEFNLPKGCRLIENDDAPDIHRLSE